MTDKIGQIKNPLTIIAIFAGIAEVSGTLVLPFIKETNQELFIYFLIGFPSILIILFFFTLNFNNKVLYAPSDYTDETNYIKINKYDISAQKNVEVKVPKDNHMTLEFIRLNEKVDGLTARIFEILESRENDKQQQTTSPGSEELVPKNEAAGNSFLVTNFNNAGAFINHMRRFGVDFEIYLSPGEDNNNLNYSDHQSIWLGKNIKLNVAKIVLKQAKKFYPHLKYIYLDHSSGDIDTIYIGGSTKTAVERFSLLPLETKDFSELQTFEDLESFHQYIENFTK